MEPAGPEAVVADPDVAENTASEDQLDGAAAPAEQGSTYSAQPDTDENQPRVRNGESDTEETPQYSLSASWSEKDACHLYVTVTPDPGHPTETADVGIGVSVSGKYITRESVEVPPGKAQTINLRLRHRSPSEGYMVDGDGRGIDVKSTQWKPDDVDKFNQTLESNDCVSKTTLELSYTPGSCQLTIKAKDLPETNVWYFADVGINKIYSRTKFWPKGTETSATVQHSLLGRTLPPEGVDVELIDKELNVLVLPQSFNPDGFVDDVNTNCSKPKIEFSSDDTCAITMKITNVVQSGDYKLSDNISGFSHELNLSAGDEPTIVHPIMTTMNSDSKGDYFSFTLWRNGAEVGRYEYREFGHDNDWLDANCVPPVTVTREGCELKVEGSKFPAGDYGVWAVSGDRGNWVSKKHQMTVTDDGVLSGSLPFTDAPEEDAVKIHVSQKGSATPLVTVSWEEADLTDTVKNTCMPTVAVTRDGCVLNVMANELDRFGPDSMRYLLEVDGGSDTPSEKSFDYPGEVSDGSYTLQHRITKEFDPDKPGVDIKLSRYDLHGVTELVTEMVYDDVPDSVVKECAASSSAGTDSEPLDSGKTDTAGKTGDPASGGAASTLARTGVDTHRLTVLMTLASILLVAGAASTSISRKKN